jgi:hypothetical protein
MVCVTRVNGFFGLCNLPDTLRFQQTATSGNRYWLLDSYWENPAVIDGTSKPLYVHGRMAVQGSCPVWLTYQIWHFWRRRIFRGPHITTNTDSGTTATVICIAQAVQLDRKGSIPGSEHLSLFRSVQNGSMSQWTPIQLVPGLFTWGLKLPGSEADHWVLR